MAFMMRTRIMPTSVDRLVIAGGKIALELEEGTRLSRPEADLEKMLRAEIEPPLEGLAFPDGIKFGPICRDPYVMFVHQAPPQIRSLRWIANDSPSNFGEGVTYRTVRLGFPYVITLVLFYRSGDRLSLTKYNELYFSNRPLRSLDDQLCFPALLNVSRVREGDRFRAWVCSERLKFPPEANWVQQLEALIEHTWNGSFNRSSEHHEGASFYSDAEGLHPDLHPVERWQKATAEKVMFALSVDWRPVPMLLGELIEQIIKENVERSAGPLRGPRIMPRRRELAARFINYTQTHPAEAKEAEVVT